MNTLLLVFGLYAMVGMPAVFMRIDSARPRRYISHLEFVEAVEAEILGKFSKERNLLIEIFGVDYKRLNRVFEVAKIADIFRQNQ
jgi:hypothetical protein